MTTMFPFAVRNLSSRPTRTTLAVIGLSIPILGILGLITLSRGVRTLFGDTLSRMPGLVVMRENTPSPIFSDLPANMADPMRRIPGVRVVVPQVWKLAPTIEGKNLFGRAAIGLLSGSGEAKGRGFLDATVIFGTDLVENSRLRYEVFRSNMLPRAEGGGRCLSLEDRGTDHIVISRKIASDYPGRDGRPKEVGDSLRIGDKAFEIVGIYDTGSVVLDAMILMDIGTARRLVGEGERTVSAFYVEPEGPARLPSIVAAVEGAFSQADARSTSEFDRDIGRFMEQLEQLLLMVLGFALAVGVVGIANTMLMSIMERYVEFGVLRTNGWERKDVLRLVTLESGCLGLLAGVLGGGVALLATTVANLLLDGGLRLEVTRQSLLLGLGIAVVVGTAGGLYPAWRASRLMPMDAIRRGSR
jgi:putative ABC transport system permease protein